MNKQPGGNCLVTAHKDLVRASHDLCCVVAIQDKRSRSYFVLLSGWLFFFLNLFVIYEKMHKTETKAVIP